MVFHGDAFSIMAVGAKALPTLAPPASEWERAWSMAGEGKQGEKG